MAFGHVNTASATSACAATGGMDPQGSDIEYFSYLLSRPCLALLLSQLEMDYQVHHSY